MKGKTHILTPLVLEDVNFQGKIWRHWTEFRAYSKLLEGVITIPEMTLTDLATIPKIVHSIIEKNGPWNAPAAIHDYLYKEQGHVSVWQEDLESFKELELTRAECDEVFLEFMEWTKVPVVTRSTIFRAVRKFGAPFWNGKLKG